MSSLSDTARNHLFHPRTVGDMRDADAVGTDGKPGGGPFVQIFVKLKADVVQEISFLTYGCGAAIASCSMLTEMVKGRTVQEAAGVSPDALLEALGGLPLGKRHCPRMAVAALRNALTRWGGTG